MTLPLKYTTSGDTINDNANMLTTLNPKTINNIVDKFVIKTITTISRLM